MSHRSLSAYTIDPVKMEPASDPIPQPRRSTIDRPSPLLRKLTNPSPSSPFQSIAQLAGTKRAAPGPLLPAFDPESAPFSSSQGSPGSIKRRALEDPENTRKPLMKYPTPVMTSETGIISSPFRVMARPMMNRTASQISTRSAMAPIPEVVLEDSGRPTTFGRSSAVSDYQLSGSTSSNRNISRVHVSAAFVPALSNEEANRVEVTCVGCNGVVVSCMAETRHLKRGQKFIATNPNAAIMIDVFNARVMIKWPPSLRSPYGSAIAELSEWSSDASSPALPSPERRNQRSSSPLKHVQHIQSPESPTPMRNLDDASIPALDIGGGVKKSESVIEIFEDETAADGADLEAEQESKQIVKEELEAEESQARLTETGSDDVEPFMGEPSSEAEEENDPIIHAFGASGENLTSRLEAVVAGSPVVQVSACALDGPVEDLPAEIPVDPAKVERLGHVQDHVIGQLAFSRLSSIPLSTIYGELPANMKRGDDAEDDGTTVTAQQLKSILSPIKCVGKITREGKDASGKQLESEYFYDPAEDDDKRRAETVQGLGRGLRGCRKTHKQYFWRRPKTP